MGPPFPGFEASERPDAATFQNLPSSTLASPPAVSPYQSSWSTFNFIPTQHQYDAVETLKGFSDDDISAWLTFVRSIEPGFQFHTDAWGLSRLQVEAIRTLSVCDNAALLGWLQQARSTSAQRKPSGTQTEGLSSPPTASATLPQLRTASPRRSRYGDANTDVSCSEPVKATAHPSHTPFNSLKANQKQLTSNNEFSASVSQKKSTSLRGEKDTHLYWCTRCENKAYKNSDDCKKHEKEHEAKYICMVDGLFDFGPPCVFCGELRPEVGHLEIHNAMLPCVNADHTPTSFKRRYDMVAHLEQYHGISHGGETLADKWKSKLSKQAFACGFCVHFFPTHQAYLKHIHTTHFKRDQKTMKDWDPKMVIKGLLLQPRVKEAWRDLLATTVAPLESRWNRAGLEKLQRRLEIGPVDNESPQSLAQAAYDDIDWGFGPVGSNDGAESTPLPPEGGQPELNSFSVQQSAALSYPITNDPVQYPNLSSSQLQAPVPSRRITTSAPWNEMGDFRTDLSNPFFSPAQDSLPYYEAPPVGRHDPNSTGPTTPYSDGHSTHQSGPALRTPWPGSSATPDPLNYDFGMAPGAHKSRHMADRPDQPDIDLQEGMIGFWTNGAVGASPTISREHLRPQPPAPAKSPSLKQRIKRACRKKSKDSTTPPQPSQELDMDLDLDDLQRKMYDDDNTRSEMRVGRHDNDGA